MQSLGRKIWESLDKEGVTPFSNLTTLGAALFRMQNRENAPGPFMVLYSETRRQAHALGLLTNSTEPAYEPTVLNARCAIYRGSYQSAEHIAHQLLAGSPTLETALYCQYVLSQINTAKAETAPTFDSLFATYQRQDTWLPAIEVQLLRSLIAESRHIEAQVRLESLLESVEQHDLFYAQAKRFASQLDPVKAEMHLQQGLARLDVKSNYLDILEGDYESFLKAETYRRLSDHLVFHYQREDKFDEASEQLSKSLKIDPNCPRLLLMIAENDLRLGRIASARDRYLQALEFGCLDRRFIEDRIGSLTTTSVAKSENPFLVTSAKQNPIFAADHEGLCAKIKSGPVHEKLHSYLDFHKPGIKTALHANTPYLSALALFENKDPWFETLTCQRAMVPGFRHELIYALLGTSEYSSADIEYLTSVDAMKEFSSNGREIYELYQNFHEISVLKRAHLARVLSAVGLFKDALTVSNEDLQLDSMESWYLRITEFFIETIAMNSGRDLLLSKAEWLYSNIPKSDISLRMRFSLAMNACVISGQLKNVEACEKWRSNASRLIHEICRNASFSEFEKHLLTSRYYRAVSYVPFLKNDKALLKYEAEQCEEHALASKPSNEIQQVLFRENCFPMLESTARIWSALGDVNRAKRYMERITSEIDPYDTKAWLQVGELREKTGDLNGALEAYLNSAKQSAPLGQIAFYKAGRAYEKLGERESARHCYSRSLQHWPSGKSPLQQILKLSLPNELVHQWALEQLAETRT